MKAFHVLIAVVLAGAATARAADQPVTTRAEPESTSFWNAIARLGVIFKSIGSLGAGARQGQVWICDLKRGKSTPITTSGPVSWPVLGADHSTVYALRTGQLVRFPASGGNLEVVGHETEWRKLIGVDGDGNVLGLLAGKPRPRPALSTRSGELHVFPQPESNSDRERQALLLQENRSYADGRELTVVRSPGGRGYDVRLTSGSRVVNLSDCGDDSCGQPSLSSDGALVLYVRDSEH
jgi:hypothetical protein